MSVTRLATVDDAPAVTALLRANREAFAPWVCATRTGSR
jgi:hypothetical protein